MSHRDEDREEQGHGRAARADGIGHPSGDGQNGEQNDFTGEENRIVGHISGGIEVMEQGAESIGQDEDEYHIEHGMHAFEAPVYIFVQGDNALCNISHTGKQQGQNTAGKHGYGDVAFDEASLTGDQYYGKGNRHQQDYGHDEIDCTGCTMRRYFSTELEVGIVMRLKKGKYLDYSNL